VEREDGVAQRRIGRFTSPAAEARFRAAHAAVMARLPAPTGTKVVPTDFGRVYVYRFGEAVGGPLVLLPGRAGSTTMWEPQLPAWSAQRSVYAVEILGEAGLSVQQRPIRDADDQAAWLAATLHGLDLGRAHLVGVSFGGWLATNLALHGSAAIASLSLIDPTMVFGRLPARLVIASLATLPLAPAFLRNRMLSWISGNAPVDDEPTATVIAAAMREFHLALPPPTYPTDDQLRGLHIPTLALIAGRSKIHNSRKAFDRATTLLPDGHAELWVEATHAISGEFAAQVTTRVLGFVGHVDGGQA
jgi:pimeloyl-ACP methyl ester carboxylesterase